MKKSISKRTRRTREEWQVLVNHYDAGSDLSAYCKQAGITVNRFQIWQRRFNQTGFVEVPFSSTPETESDSPHWDIELTLGKDITLRMRRP